MVLYIFIQGLLLRSALIPFGIALKFKEWFGLLTITLFGNYFIPAAGLGARAIYLNKVHHMDITSFSVSVSAIYLIELFVFGIGGAVGLALATDLARYDVVVIFSGFVVGSIILLFLLISSFRFPWEDKKIFRLANAVLDSWECCRSHKRSMLLLFVYTLLEFLLYSLLFFYSFEFLASAISPEESFVYSAISDFSFFIKFTPAGVGTYETSILYAGNILGDPFDIALAVTALIRLVTIAVLIILTPVMAVILFKEIREQDSSAKQSI